MDGNEYRDAEQRMWLSKGVEPRERWLDLKRLGVRVRVQEIGDGPPVLFVHGGSIAGSSWAALAAPFDGYRRIILDRPGCGLSDPLPGRMTTESLATYGATLIPDVLDALELPTADVVATSFGSHLSLHSAAAAPGRVKHLVLIAWPFGASRPLPLWLRMTAIPGMSRLMAALPANERSARMVFRGIGHSKTLAAGRISDEDIACLVALLRHTETLRNETAPARDFFSLRRGLKPGLVLGDTVLKKVTCPVLLLWGEDDPFGGAAVAKQFAGRLPRAQLEMIPATGHAPWLDRAPFCIEKIREAFETDSSSAATGSSAFA